MGHLSTKKVDQTKLKNLRDACAQPIRGLFIDQIADRHEILKATLEDLEQIFQCGMAIYSLMVVTSNEIHRCLNIKENYGPEFRKKHYEALEGIKSVYKFVEPIGGRNHGAFILSPEDKSALKNVERKLKIYGQMLIDSDDRSISRLKPKGKKGRLKIRDFILPYQKLTYLFLKEKTNLPPGERQYIINKLFYGVGLEKDDGTYEISKLINQARLPSKLRQFRFLGQDFLQKIESSR